MKTWKCLLMTVVLPFAVACGNDEEMANWEENDNQIRFESVHPSQSSRATSTNFENKDEIGVYMVGHGVDLQLGGNELNNEMFMYNGRLWTSPQKVYWNKGNHDVFAYYPYQSQVNSIEDFSFKIALDQNVADMGNGLSGYEASDFLWASAMNVAASANPIKLKFNHCMSKMVIKLVKGENFEGEIPNDAIVYVHSTVPMASVNLANGGVSKDEYVGTETVIAKKISNSEFTACLVPQNLLSRRPLVEVVTQGVSYLMEGKISLRQGTQHTVIVTLSKNPEQAKIEIGGEIVDWK